MSMLRTVIRPLALVTSLVLFMPLISCQADQEPAQLLHAPSERPAQWRIDWQYVDVGTHFDATTLDLNSVLELYFQVLKCEGPDEGDCKVIDLHMGHHRSYSSTMTSQWSGPAKTTSKSHYKMSRIVERSEGSTPVQKVSSATVYQRSLPEENTHIGIRVRERDRYFDDDLGFASATLDPTSKAPIAVRIEDEAFGFKALFCISEATFDEDGRFSPSLLWPREKNYVESEDPFEEQQCPTRSQTDS